MSLGAWWRPPLAARRRGAWHALGRLGAVFCALSLLASSRPACAQEFAAAAPLTSASAATMLERGLPPATAAASFEAIAVSWFGLSELATTSAACAGGWRGARGAIGLSRTGQGEIGWSTLAIAGGWADARSGAALRAILRGQSGEGAVPRRGVEAGAGAWAAAGRRVRLWASAPQLWVDGEAPPVERRLELGLALAAGEVQLWLTRSMAPGAPTGLRGEHAAGLAARAGVLTLWTQVQDAPARGGFGLTVAWRRLRVSCESDTHPLLGETIKLGLAAGGSAP